MTPGELQRISRPIVAIGAVNSTDYVRKVLACCADRKVVLVASEQVRNQQYFGLPVAEHIAPTVTHGWLRLDYVPDDDPDPAQIVSTSGTEGVPKGIVLSHRNLADTVRRLNQIMRVDSSISEYVGIPVTHSFGLGRCRAVLAAGGRVYVPEKGFNLSEIQEMLAAGEINAISAVPTLWRLVLQNTGLFSSCAHKVRWIEIGSQYMSPQEKAALRSLFRNARIVQHYGLTEASRTTFLDISEASDANLESVGTPIGDVEVSIAGNGRVRIRGSNVAIGRVADGRIHAITDQQGWFETSDRGHLAAGYLFYDGRDDDLINCGGLKVSPEPLEAALKSAFPQLQEVAICGVADALRGEGFFVAIRGGSETSNEAITDTLDRLLAARNVHARSSIHVRRVDAMPTTANGKIQRRKLAQLYQPEAAGSAAADKDLTITGLFAKRFGASRVRPDASFTALGGDSLNYVQMGVDLEKLLGRLPPNWENIPVSGLEQLAKGTGNEARRTLQPLDTSTALRAFAITTVVAIHAGYSLLYGATIMLMMLVGFNFARFQSGALFRGEVWSTTWNFARKILLPFYLIMVVYTLISGTYELKTYLLISNFFYNTSQFLIPVWFVLNLMQILVLIGLFFTLRPLRSWLAGDPDRNSTLLLLAFTAFHAFMYLFVQHRVYDLFYPHMYLPVFWLGWSVYFAHSRTQKVLVTLLLLALVPLNVNVGIQHIWLLLSGLLLIWVPTVSLPRAVNVVATAVAAATFHIFIFNEFVLWQTHKAFDRLGIESRPLAFLATMSFCMLVWWLLDRRPTSGARGMRKAVT